MIKPSITVIGSINMDMITESISLPKQGETILGQDFTTNSGGKGANVRMIGRVGDDQFGPRLKQTLTTNEINCDGVTPVTDCCSGVATILLTDK